MSVSKDKARPAKLDKRRVRLGFDRAARQYESRAVLQREIRQRLLERLDLVRIAPATVVDVGCASGGSLGALRQRYPAAQLVGVDLSTAMLAQARAAVPRRRWRRGGVWPVAADGENLPLRRECCDLLFSNLTVQWFNDLPAAFADWRRVLRPRGLLMFTCLGPDTLKELRTAWGHVDGGRHVHGFPDMHDVGDALLQAGLAEPVMDAEWLTLTYADVDAMVADVRGIGAGNAAATRTRGLTGPRRWADVRAAYEQLRCDGRLPATYEVVYGHAWVPEPKRGSAMVQLEGRRQQ